MYLLEPLDYSLFGNMTNPAYCHSFMKQKLVELFFYGTRQTQSYEPIEHAVSRFLQYVRRMIHERNMVSHSLKEYRTDAGDDSDFEDPEYGFYLYTLCRMILYTLDAREGKGEHTITYAMLYALWKYYPSKSMRLITFMVYPGNKKHAIGGWKDTRKIAEYVYNTTHGDASHPLIGHCIFLMNNHLYMDKQLSSWSDAEYYLSTVSRWIPRESSSAKWLFDEMSHDWCLRYTPYCLPRKNRANDYLAIKKYKTTYRKLVSSISALAPIRETPPTLDIFVAEACSLLRHGHFHGHLSTESINRKWNKMIEQNRICIGDVLPALDISGGMNDTDDVLMTAIGVVCFLLEMTTLEKRILTIDQTPTWIVVSSEDGFFETVKKIMNVVSRYGKTTARLDRSMSLLSRAFQSTGMPSSLALVIVSDMKTIQKSDMSMDSDIREIFGANLPHLVYWNVGTHTEGDGPLGEFDLPCDYDQVGANVISGRGIRCAKGILPKWHYSFDYRSSSSYYESDSHCYKRKRYMLANTPFDGMCSVLSMVDVSFLSW